MKQKFPSAQPTPNREQNQAMLELCRDAKEENYKLTDAPLASAAQPTTRGRSHSRRSVPICDHLWAIYISVGNKALREAKVHALVHDFVHDFWG